MSIFLHSILFQELRQHQNIIDIGQLMVQCKQHSFHDISNTYHDFHSIQYYIGSHYHYRLFLDHMFGIHCQSGRMMLRRHICLLLGSMYCIICMFGIFLILRIQLCCHKRMLVLLCPMLIYQGMQLSSCKDFLISRIQLHRHRHRLGWEKLLKGKD